MPSINSNKELLNAINDEIIDIKKWSNMPAISDELYNELLTEFNNNSHYFFNDSYYIGE